MKINLPRLYDMARNLPYDQFENILKSTVSGKPITERDSDDIECYITLKTKATE